MTFNSEIRCLYLMLWVLINYQINIGNNWRGPETLKLKLALVVEETKLTAIFFLLLRDFVTISCTDYGDPEIQKYWTFGLGQTFWAEIFSAGLSAPILILWVPCPCFPLFNHYSLINRRQLHIFFNQAKTWRMIVCWFCWISLFLPEFTWCQKKMFCE